MDYTTFKKLAIRYVEEHYEDISILSIYNSHVREKIHTYMVKLMLSECDQNIQKQQKAITDCKAYENRLFKEYLK